ncbi:amino acid adenylation domain-containing protein [Clostridium estertheticum]|uniref:non-ribosomal peptide synthetase n=1 Tax=Clostridium estertheticum TaxID=238834 RepID=UPI001C0BD084|nr:non-ribosomal peptide synthetase [Clostridium estertheticum]MBU3198527.1 amino acid adenylation domain-containing protein [Clostridium estertheticum]WAG64508.1 amino acid adenylation domain-containing protein [Clostridium estertheticum]
MNHNAYSNKELLNLKKYWLSKFSTEVNEINLLTDFNRTREYLKAEYSINFESHISDLLLKSSKGNDLLIYILLLTGLKILLYKYTNQCDITVGSPILSDTEEGGNYYSNLYLNNNFIALRDELDNDMTFKELLINIKQTVIKGYDNQEYPIEELYKDLEINNSGISLLRIILSFDNIHSLCSLNQIESVTNDFTFNISNTNNLLKCKVIYNSKLLKESYIITLCESYFNILQQSLLGVNTKLKDIKILNQRDIDILLDFDKISEEPVSTKLISELFEEQVLKSPENDAVSVYYDLKKEIERLKSKQLQKGTFEALKYCCFKVNPYICKLDDELLTHSLLIEDRDDIEELKLLKTHLFNYVLINKKALELLSYFNGDNNLLSIYEMFENSNLKCFILNGSMTEHSGEVSTEKVEISLDNNINSFINLIRLMYISNLIDLSCVNTYKIEFANKPIEIFKIENGNKYNYTLNETLNDSKSKGKSILLLGFTPGASTIGILYIASYLRRNGIDAYCKFNNLNANYLFFKKDIEELINEIKPQIVAVSIKWFPHISRGLEICKLIKDISKDIEIVIGGNTASLFDDDLIVNDFIDYVVSGDGEFPLLKICKGEEYIPNCVYKRNGRIIKNPITYIQDSINSNDIFLSDLDDIFVSKESLFSVPYYYIYTGKGCSMNCFYCGGCLDAQLKEFNRNKPFLRNIREVKNDIIEIKKYASTLMFVDSFDIDSLSYYKDLWQEIDLSNHFCTFYFHKLPEIEFINILTKVFKYVYINLDLCTLSERHRNELCSLRLIKPMPNDRDLLDFMSLCDNYKNIEVGISLIAGLPYHTKEDMENDKILLNMLMNYPVFKGIKWEKLHDKPRTSILDTCENHGMYSQATTFDEFLEYSNQNMNNEEYPDLYSFNFPYTYFNEGSLNSNVSKHYSEINNLFKNKNKHLDRSVKVYDTISYNELNIRANTFAKSLKAYGIGPDNIVAIMDDQSINMVIGILGILKAGGAYLPIDPSYPENRIKYILDDSNAKILIVNSKYREKIKFKNIIINGEFININQENILIKDNYKSLKLNDCSNLVYVIYTSGTTGEPNGVMIEHKSLVNFIKWRLEEYKYSTQDNTLQPLSLSFDGFGTNFYSSILSGGNLILLNGDSRKDISSLIKVIKEKKITNMSLIPIMYKTIIEGAKKEDLKSLRFVVLAGERAQEELINLSETMNPNLIIINEYGPTENTITTTSLIGMSNINTSIIGKPISNNKVYILNKNNDILPIGVYGEICVSGQGLARGYMNNEELNTQKFVPNPFCIDEKLYKTGDIGRRLADGSIELLRRADKQVKIRGYRIELGEIETCLLAKEFINEAIITSFEEKNNNISLCAYFTSDNKLESDFIKKSLSKELPEYMIPTYFIQLKSFPVNVNGKINKNLLIKPNENNYDKKEISCPTNDIELKLLNIWKDVLIKDNISMNDNFFDIGGNSILLMRVQSKIEKSFLNDISIIDLFNYPTISKLSSYIQEKKSEDLTCIQLNEIELSEDYFVQIQEERENILFKFDIADNIINKIDNIARLEDKESYDIFVAVYLYLFSQISKEKNLTAYTMNKTGNKIVPLNLNISEITDFSKILNAIHDDLNNIYKTDEFNIENIFILKFNKNKKSIIPFISNKSIVLFEKDLFDVFDISFSINIEGNTANIVCEYNEKRMRREGIEKIINGYIELLNLITDKY